MLTHLSIANIVLIDKASLDLGAGFCVLTGETGAGKSILLDALGLVLGERSESRLVRHGETQASVTAEFTLSNPAILADALDALGIEPSDHIILRRQLNADGKTRCFINDAPVSVKALRDVGEELVEIHGQQHQQGLTNPLRHGELLDRFGVLHKDLIEVREHHLQWKKIEGALAELEEAIVQLAKEKEYLDHMLAELGALKPEVGEEERLTDERTRMMQAEKSLVVIQDALDTLGQHESVAERLRHAQGMLIRAAGKGMDTLQTPIDALERAMVELDAAESSLTSLIDSANFNPHELERTEERLFALKAASRKYQLSPEELPALHAQVKEKLHLLASQEKTRATLQAQLKDAQNAYEKVALALRAKRQKAAAKLEKSVMQELGPLKMGATRFHVVLKELDAAQWSARGMEQVSFEVATNAGSEPAPLHKIASGGELSRFMLALALVLAHAKATPTMIFDEIDAGTSGAVADAIGKRLAELGTYAQVLAVSHLPQVAASAAQHITVEKEEKGGKTFTRLRPLTGKARTEELARMLSGAEISSEARKAADKLLKAV